MSLPTPDRLASARWFGGKAGAVGRIEECDRLDLGGGAALAILRVDGADLYVWSEGEAASALLQSGSDPERGLWQFRDAGVTLPTGAQERPIGLDQSNTSYVVGERVVVKLFRRVWPGIHPEVELVEYLTGRVTPASRNCHSPRSGSDPDFRSADAASPSLHT